MSSHPHTQTLTISSIAVDRITGWHNPNLQIEGGITTPSVTANTLHVTGPPTVPAPFSSTYSTVFDGSVHITSGPVVSDAPIIATAPIVGLAEPNQVATVDYVQQALLDAFTIRLPVMGIYDFTPNVDADPVVFSAGDRVISMKVGSPGTNNKIWVNTGLAPPAAWSDTGEATNGVALVTISPYNVEIPGNSTIIYSSALGTNDVLRWTRWYLRFDHDYLLNSGYDPKTAVGLRHTTINAWLDQPVKTTTAPVFAGITVTNATPAAMGYEVNTARYVDISAYGPSDAAAFIHDFTLTVNCVWLLEVELSGTAGASNYTGRIIVKANTATNTYDLIKSTQNTMGTFVATPYLFSVTPAFHVELINPPTVTNWEVRVSGVGTPV